MQPHECDPAEPAAPFGSPAASAAASFLASVVTIALPVAAVGVGLLVAAVRLLLNLLQGKFVGLAVAGRDVCLVFALALLALALGTFAVAEVIKSKVYEPYRIFRQERGAPAQCTHEVYRAIGYTYAPPSARASAGFMPDSNASDPHLQPGLAPRFLDHLRAVAAMVQESVPGIQRDSGAFVDDTVAALVIARARAVAARRYAVEKGALKVIAGLAVPSALLVMVALVANAVGELQGGGVLGKHGALALIARNAALAAAAGLGYLHVVQVAKRVSTQSERLLGAIGHLESAYKDGSDEDKVFHANALEAFAWSYPRMPSNAGRLIVPGAYAGLAAYIVYHLTRNTDLRRHVAAVRNMTSPKPE